MLLVREGLWQFIESDCPAEIKIPATNTAPENFQNENEIVLWIQKDGRALATIALCIDDIQLSLIKKSNTSKEAWKALRDYHQKNSITNKANILKEICMMRLQETENAEDHLFRMEGLFEKLACLGRDLEEEMKVILILQSLPDSYSTLCTALEARSEADLSVSMVKMKIIDQYQKNKNKDNEIEKALKVSYGKFTFTCNYCKEEGHIKRNCPKLKAKMSDNSSDSDKKTSDDKKKPESYGYVSFAARSVSNKNHRIVDHVEDDVQEEPRRFYAF